MGGGRNLRIGIVAEHAFIRDGPARHWVRIVEAWIHSPVAAVLRVPGHRKFDQRSVLFAMQVRPRVVS